MVIFVDWGSSNRRCYKCEGDTIIDEIASGPGALSVAPSDWEGHVAEIRSSLNCGEDTLVLMAGMVGSNRGWIEVPYVPCPAGLGELAAGLSNYLRRSSTIVIGRLAPLRLDALWPLCLLGDIADRGCQESKSCDLAL